jgi:hypothetical protein
MTARRCGAFLFLAAVLMTQTGTNECTGDVVHDPGFDVWCGDELCSWEVEKGEVRKVATWHDGDPGVELRGDEVVISQLSTDAPAGCLRFQLVADVEETATAALEMDLDDDGTVEYERAIPTSRWAELVYRVELVVGNTVRFRLRKSGAGRAVLAQIRAVHEDVDACGGERVSTPQPLGAFCAALPGGGDELCESGVCEERSQVCGECRADGECPGQVCGLESPAGPSLQPYRSCVAPASRALGELCAVGGECASGVCCDGLCSECCEGGPGCAAGQDCVRAEAAADEIGPLHNPPSGSANGLPAGPPEGPPSESWCAPGDGAPGEACRRDEQCASGSCGGGEPMRVCPWDGRPCAQDADCWLAVCIEAGRSGGACQ